ncbi:unnamed protein product [Staurois parvus]|uniref:Uncharacterized protein n=1 Tax=Staurois parvus TaxID=386267 RepID=A0ABN9DQK0_9NEOB|nr:unnamed protein product [Staurois parvus]
MASLMQAIDWSKTSHFFDRPTGPLCEVQDHVITGWPISDHMQSSKQDVTS